MLFPGNSLPEGGQAGCCCLQDDGLSMGDMGVILDSFPGQSLDFFGALRSATYDNQIRAWIKEIIKGDIDADGAAMQELSRRLINRCARCCAAAIPPSRLASLCCSV